MAKKPDSAKKKPITLKVPGRLETLDSSAVIPDEFKNEITVKGDVRRIRIDAARALDANLETLSNVPADAIVELELEGGVRIWQRVDDLRKQLRRNGSERSVYSEDADDDDTTLVIPTQFALSSRSRSATTGGLEALTVFDIDNVIEKLGEKGAVKLAQRLEQKLIPEDGIGLYHIVQNSTVLELDQIKTDTAPASAKPLLVLIHGTASNTDGSFGQLWKNETSRRLWLPLLETYGENAYAFQHHTLSRSPVDNAIELLEQLPHGVRLHIVSHSRGGLVGELLCRVAGVMENAGDDDDNGDDRPFVPFDQQTVDLIYRRYKEQHDNEEHADYRRLTVLAELLKQKNIRVERFVRVACPASGTTLAGGRLDLYLSIILTLLGRIPGLAANPFYDLVKTFMLAIIKSRTKPEQLPGLEAMMPEAPLIQLLNQAQPVLDADLTVIAGDIEGSGIWGRIKVWASDLYYLEDHDYVVNTSAMYGGSRRSAGARRFFHSGSEVNHFNYFRNRESVVQLIAGLQGGKGSFKPFEPEPLAIDRGYVAQLAEQRSATRGGRPEPAKPVVFVLPGLLGSHLKAGADRVWLDIGDLASGGIAKLSIASGDITPAGLVGLLYAPLVQYLGNTHEVVPFSYDWRLSLEHSAQRLAEAVEDRLALSEQPVRIIAHSLGGLVAHMMIAKRPGLWQQMCKRQGCRLLLLGAPGRGSYAIPRLLLGQERTLQLLALLDLKNDSRTIAGILGRFPGLLELLPVKNPYDDKTHDFYQRDVWRALKKCVPDWKWPRVAVLQDAAKVRELLDESPLDGKNICYVAGQATETPIGMNITNEGVEFIGTHRGDGRVCWDDGAPAGVDVWYMPGVAHGQLAGHRPAFPALLDLLQTGNTRHLSTSAPITRDASETFVMPPDEVAIFPDQRELAAAALGYRVQIRPPRSEYRIPVHVVHGDLRYAHHPIAVGHYQGDTIVSAEAALDRFLDGRLRARHQLGYYPGPLETSEVLLDYSDSRIRGAVIIGLGGVGELAPGALKASFTRAALMYAVARAECVPADGQLLSGEPQPIALSTLLVGSGAGGLSISDSVMSILRAVTMANTALKMTDFGNRVRIGELEFIELYEDRAVMAAKVLRRLIKDTDLGESYSAAERLVTITGNRRRIELEDDKDWWRRLQVTAKKGGLHFNALTNFARAEASLLSTQRQLVDQFVERAIGSTRRDRKLSETLFELLIPNRFKEQAPEQRDLVLVLDKKAAQYPWELVQDRMDKEEKPFAVQIGIIRQLQTDRFREQVITPTDLKALVVGDPPSELVELEGAQREAHKIAGLLSKYDFQVNEQIRIKGQKNIDAQSIIGALFADGYKVLHLAGHGVFEAKLKVREQPEKGDSSSCINNRGNDGSVERVSGMVLGNDVFLTPVEIKQMRQVPELVFINCCHLGYTEADRDDPLHRYRNKLAANLATQLIEMGVKAIVAAGWAIDDNAAELFAETFYQKMLDGYNFGEAVLLARKKTYKFHGDSNTWGAYQCYGDPAYVLTGRARASATHRREDQYVAAAEIIVELKNISSWADTDSQAQSRQLLQRLQSLIEDHIEPDAEWSNNPEICEALGDAYGQLDQFPKAVEQYKKALRAEKALYSVRAIEQLCNLQMRWAVDLVLHPSQEDAPDPEALADEAVQRLQHLADNKFMEKTVERLSLLGSMHKRQAHIRFLRKKSFDEFLQKMNDYYRDAHELHLQINDDVAPYPLLNWLASDIVLCAFREQASSLSINDWQQANDLLMQGERFADRRYHSERSFWNGIIKAECHMLRGMLNEDLDERKHEVVKGYREARRRGASARQFRSVTEHLEFLLALLPDKNKTLAKPDKSKETIKQSLRWIRDHLD